MLKYLFIVTITIYFFGCSIEQTIYFQDIEVKGPINNPPIFVTTNKSMGKTVISPKINFNPNVSLSGQVNAPRVNRDNIFQVDTVDGRLKASNRNVLDFKGNNFNWKVPDFTGGLDLDLPIGKKTSLIGSFNFTSYDKFDLYGGSFGISFYNVFDANNAIRFSAGLSLQEIAYNAKTIIITDYESLFGSSENDVFFCWDIDKSSSINVFVSLTYNTSFPEFPMNIFFNASYFTQTVIDYTENHPNPQYFIFGTNIIKNETNYRTGFISLSPGLVYDISDWNRIILGGTFIFNTTELKAKNLNFVPMLKMDFML